MVNKSENGFCFFFFSFAQPTKKWSWPFYCSSCRFFFFIVFTVGQSVVSITQPTRIDIENAELDPLYTCCVEFSPCQCLNLMPSQVYDQQEEGEGEKQVGTESVSISISIRFGSLRFVSASIQYAIQCDSFRLFVALFDQRGREYNAIWIRFHFVFKCEICIATRRHTAAVIL